MKKQINKDKKGQKRYTMLTLVKRKHSGHTDIKVELRAAPVLKMKMITKDQSFNQENTKILNIYLLNGGILKCMGPKLKELQRVMSKSIMVGDFNTLLSISDRTENQQGYSGREHY